MRDLIHGKKIDVGFGGQFTVNIWPDGLDRYYDEDLGYGFQFFFRIRPSLHTHNKSMEHGSMK